MSRQLGKWLKAERERLGFSPQELSVQLGIDKSSLYGYERGDRSMPHVHLCSMVKLGANPMMLLRGSIESTFTRAGVIEIVDAVLKVTQMSSWSKLDDIERRETAIAFALRGTPTFEGGESDVA